MLYIYIFSNGTHLEDRADSPLAKSLEEEKEEEEELEQEPEEVYEDPKVIEEPQQEEPESIETEQEPPGKKCIVTCTTNGALYAMYLKV